jgi:hypothetical protein
MSSLSNFENTSFLQLSLSSKLLVDKKNPQATKYPKNTCTHEVQTPTTSQNLQILHELQ